VNPTLRGLHLDTPATSSHILRFDGYAVDMHRCTLQRGDELLALRPKAFDVLRHLAENPGRVVGKQELLEAVWAHHVVTDDALVQCIRDVRQALSDQAHTIIKSVPRRGYLFCAEPSRDGASAIMPSHPAQTIGHCRTKDGVRIAMATVGQGPPLVRPPTWFNHLEYDWHVQFRGALYRFLAERAQLIRYDGRSNGLSDRYVPGVSFELLQSDLEAVVDAHHLQRYALLGISQGAAIAIAHAARYPERVSRLVLNGAYALGSNKRGSLRDQETAQAYLTLMRHGWGDEHSSFLRTFSTLYFPGASAEEIRALAQLQRMAMSAEAAVKLRLACADIDVVDLLPKVKVPTLVLHSRHDNAVPFDEGRRLAAAIPNARFVALESENHVPMPDEPAWPTFIAEIDAFLSERA
jgi:pimeloyl-ACP methyl ester carboxylesterase/DNA-binding winged helix-turn-helix (wHTH) protein